MGLSNCPRLEHAFHLQAEIVVQARCGVALDAKAAPRLFFQLGRRLGRFLEAPFAFVFVERHGGYCNSGFRIREASVKGGSCASGDAAHG